jgi:hypothetical protein
VAFDGVPRGFAVFEASQNGAEYNLQVFVVFKKRFKKIEEVIFGRCRTVIFVQ